MKSAFTAPVNPHAEEDDSDYEQPEGEEEDSNWCADWCREHAQRHGALCFRAHSGFRAFRAYGVSKSHHSSSLTMEESSSDDDDPEEALQAQAGLRS